MKILTVCELRSLPNIDDNSLRILMKILHGEVINFIKSRKEKKYIPAGLMKDQFGIDCHILFVLAQDGQTVRPVAVPLENKIFGGGKAYSSQYKAYGLDDGETYFVKSFEINDESLPEYKNEVETLGKKQRLLGMVFSAETEVYLVTTFVKGMDLAKYKQEMPSTVEVKHFLESVGIFISASHQLSQFHQLDLIHRDIKPGNFMLDADKQCHLVDFGSSSSDKASKPTSWGTGPYLAPELDQSMELLEFTQESDLYALGCTFAEIFGSFNTQHFKVSRLRKNKHLEPLHKEISLCIEGLKCENTVVRTSHFTRLIQLQRVPDSFKSKPEAYTFLIMLLTQWKACYEISPELDQAIQVIKVAYENHEQNTTGIKVLLQALVDADGFLQPHKAMLAILIHAFDTIKNLEVGHDDILPRRFESDFACHLIQKPTTQMMAAIKLVSDAIVKILQEYKDCEPPTLEYQVIQDFLKQIVECDMEILFGAAKTKLTIEEVITILAQNKPEDFLKIQHISFEFARVALRKLALHDLPAHDPKGQFLAILQKYQQKMAVTEETALNFYHRMAAIKDNESDGKGEGFRFRSYICDELFYQDELFTFEATRGRQGSPNTKLKTNQVGLMKFEHASHTRGLLTLPGQSWYADCKTQAADKSSLHYTSALNTDCPYITGPSGMTSLFMNMMFLLVNPQDSETILAYSLGVMTYIVGAGYHSMKEVLIPMVKCVDIVPGYPHHQGMEYLTAAPLYNHYFMEIAKFDEEFGDLHQEIWASHLEYFTTCYMPICMRKNCLPQQIFGESKVADEAKAMMSIVSHSVNLCLASYSKESTGGFSLFTSSTSQQTIALQLLNNVCQRQYTVTSVFRQIQSYCKGTFSPGNGIKINQEMQRSFIGFLFNSLQDSPTLLSYLNLTMQIEKTISISSGVDLCSEVSQQERMMIHLAIKSSNIGDEVRIMENSDIDLPSNALSKVMIANWK